jgi:hypothetical protein
MKCPKCGSENDKYLASIKTHKDCYQCSICECYWTDWQQAIIDQQKVEINKLNDRMVQRRQIALNLVSLYKGHENELSRLHGILREIIKNPVMTTSVKTLLEIQSIYCTRSLMAAYKKGFSDAAEIARKGLGKCG